MRLERRSAPRYRMATHVRFQGGSGVTRNLSTTGLFFLTGSPFDVGQPVELSITFDHADPENPTELTCRGRVCRVEEREPEPGGGTVTGVAVAADSFAFAAAGANKDAPRDGSLRRRVGHLPRD